MIARSVGCLMLAAMAAAGLRGQPVMTIRAARMIDGRGGILANAVLEISGTKIVRIDQRTGPVTHDLGDATLLPGLIDVHVHVTYVGNIPPFRQASSNNPEVQANAKAMLLAGFTTVQSVGAAEDRNLRRRIDSGEIVGPRILTSLGQIIPGNRTPGQLREVVRQAKADGADLIKLFASGEFRAGGQLNITQEQADAVCSEARALGLRVLVHAHSPESIGVALKAGATGIEHGFLADDASFQAMAAARVYFDPTMSAPLLDAGLPGMPDDRRPGYERLRIQLPVVFRQALAAGLRMPLGSDAAGFRLGRNAEELVMRTAAGQKPMDAIISATSLAAESLRMEKTIGTLAPGYEADLIAVPGDPLQDITAVQRVTFVMKGGKVFKQL